MKIQQTTHLQSIRLNESISIPCLSSLILSTISMHLPSCVHANTLPMH